MREINHWINGRAIAGTGDRRLPVYDPATGDQQAYVTAATADETNRAVATALAAYPAWRAQSLSRRAEVMFHFRDLVDANRKEIAALLSSEHGKTIADADGEVARGLENVEFATGAPHLLKGGYSELA
jgi:malonate-semialdehyde dehydrogenase (acetylating)/methylmalonate-semialdehyde dehydrogenase